MNVQNEEIVRKTVGFNEEEQTLLDHVNKQNEKFATYVKKLIRKDMEQESLDKKIENKIDEYLSNYLKNHTLVLKEKATDKVEFEESDKAALLNFIKK